MTRYCECGRRCLVMPAARPRSCRAARRRRPYRLKGHDLCLCCYARRADAGRAVR